MPPPELNSALLRILERSFANLAGADAVIDAGELQRALGFAPSTSRGGSSPSSIGTATALIRRDEFLEGVRKLVLGSPRDRLLFAFRLHDHDGDGSLDRLDLVRMITLALAEDDVSAHDAYVERLVAALLSEADANRDGRISFEEFESALGRHPRLLDQMTRDEARWLAPNEDLLARLEEGRGGELPRSPLLEAGWSPGLRRRGLGSRQRRALHPRNAPEAARVAQRSISYRRWAGPRRAPSSSTARSFSFR